MQHVRARHRGLGGVRCVGQRSYAAVSEQDVGQGQPGLRDQLVDLAQQILGLTDVAASRRWVAVVPDVSGADHVPTHPGDDQHQSAVLTRLVVDDVVRRPGEGTHDQVAALGATVEPRLGRATRVVQRLVDPRAGHVVDHRCPNLSGLAAGVVGVPDAAHPSVLDDGRIGLHVGGDDRPVVSGIHRKLDAEPLGILDLAVVEHHRAGEPVVGQAREALPGATPAQHPVGWRRLTQ